MGDLILERKAEIVKQMHDKSEELIKLMDEYRALTGEFPKV